jgi:RNase adapter protein RapZ
VRLKQPALPRPQLLVITGQSGSGKTHVSRALEDLGWFCVDNLPTALIPRFAELICATPDLQRSVLVVDVRERDFLKRFPDVLARTRQMGVAVSLLFLEAGERVLLRRFSETRRPHPLAGFDQTPLEAIREEQTALRPIRKMADLILDTSEYSVHQLRDYIRERYDVGERGSELGLTVMSFGYKYGVPSEADLVFDVRFLPNPNFVRTLKRLTGLDAGVVRFLDREPETSALLRRLGGFLGYLIPRYRREGKSHLTIAVGCTGGRHRSVMIAERLATMLRKKAGAGGSVGVRHRDLRLG